MLHCESSHLFCKFYFLTYLTSKIVELVRSLLQCCVLVERRRNKSTHKNEHFVCDFEVDRKKSRVTMARDTIGDALAGGELKWLGAAKENTHEISERLKKAQKMTVDRDSFCVTCLIL